MRKLAGVSLEANNLVALIVELAAGEMRESGALWNI